MRTWKEPKLSNLKIERTEQFKPAYLECKPCNYRVYRDYSYTVKHPDKDIMDKDCPFCHRKLTPVDENVVIS